MSSFLKRTRILVGKKVNVLSYLSEKRQNVFMFQIILIPLSCIIDEI